MKFFKAVASNDIGESRDSSSHLKIEIALLKNKHENNFAAIIKLLKG